MLRLIRNIFLIGLAGIVLLGLLIQLVPYGRNHTNPPVLAEPKWDSTQTQITFMGTCGDCHSNQTVWPWYSNIAPASWLVYSHVAEGRSRFNVSEWGRQRNSGRESAEIVQEGEMPPWDYQLMHPLARLAGAEKQSFVQGLIATFGSGE